jgi:hypothetical protein
MVHLFYLQLGSRHPSPSFLQYRIIACTQKSQPPPMPTSTIHPVSPSPDTLCATVLSRRSVPPLSPIAQLKFWQYRHLVPPLPRTDDPRRRKRPCRSGADGERSGGVARSAGVGVSYTDRLVSVSCPPLVVPSYRPSGKNAEIMGFPATCTRAHDVAYAKMWRIRQDRQLQRG